MANLGAYINFSVYLANEGGPPFFKLIDTGSYPSGVPVTLTGYFIVQQPDRLSVQVGSFASPTIYWNSGQLTQPTTELRLNTANSFQNGAYTVQYFIRATGYDDTELTKEFNLNYTRPVQTMVKAFDLFTPNLSVVDATVYGQSGMTLGTTIRNWVGEVISVEGTNQAISGTGASFDLSYAGNYYDSRYNIRLISYLIYTLNSPYDWVNIIDTYQSIATYYAEIPPTLEELLEALTELKYTIDTCICGKKCGCSECETDKANYLLAVSIYIHMVERGRADDLSGLSLYVLQLQKIFNSCVTPNYINTNEIIPAYNWGGGSGGSVAWDDITGKPSTIRIEWSVGDPGFPGNGASTMTNAGFANVPTSRIQVFRNNALQYWSDQGAGNTYVTKASAATNTISFSAALSTDEEIIIIIMPL